jgi:hypothetical protein
MQPWERQPGESSRAYEAARLYFEMGPGRSLVAVGQKVGKSRGLIERWSARWNWRERAAGYDRHLAAIEMDARRQAFAEEAERWAQRQADLREQEWEASRALLQRAHDMLAHPLTVMASDEEGRTLHQPARWSMKDVATFYELAFKLARSAAELDQLSHRVRRALDREIEDALDRLESRLPRDVYVQVVEILADEDESEMPGYPA